MDDLLRKAFDCMMSDKKVRITKEGRDFWCKPTESYPIYMEVGQWFDIIAVRGDSVDIVGIHHDVMEKMNIEYIKF